MSLTTLIPDCRACGGAGYLFDHDGAEEPCPYCGDDPDACSTCDGSGITVRYDAAIGGYVPVDCPHCEGDHLLATAAYLAVRDTAWAR